MSESLDSARMLLWSKQLAADICLNESTSEQRRPECPSLAGQEPLDAWIVVG